MYKIKLYFLVFIIENDDMTHISDNSDSGFTDYNQTNSTQQIIGPLPEEGTKQPEPPSEDDLQNSHQLTTRSKSSTSSLLNSNSNSEFLNEPEIGTNPEEEENDDEDDEDDDSSDDNSNVSGMSGMSWLSASDQYQYNNHTIQSWVSFSY